VMRKKSSRKVSFGPPTTFLYIQSDQEVECRKAYWVYVALDRSRFQHKVKELETLLRIPLEKGLSAIKDKCTV